MANRRAKKLIKKQRHQANKILAYNHTSWMDAVISEWGMSDKQKNQFLENMNRNFNPYTAQGRRAAKKAMFTFDKRVSGGENVRSDLKYDTYKLGKNERVKVLKWNSFAGRRVIKQIKRDLLLPFNGITSERLVTRNEQLRYKSLNREEKARFISEIISKRGKKIWKEKYGLGEITVNFRPLKKSGVSAVNKLSRGEIKTLEKIDTLYNQDKLSELMRFGNVSKIDTFKIFGPVAEAIESGSIIDEDFDRAIKNNNLLLEMTAAMKRVNEDDGDWYKDHRNLIIAYNEGMANNNLDENIARAMDESLEAFEAGQMAYEEYKNSDTYNEDWHMNVKKNKHYHTNKFRSQNVEPVSIWD